jgi:serine/threonine-protein kinase RsbW
LSLPGAGEPPPGDGVVYSSWGNVPEVLRASAQPFDQSWPAVPASVGAIRRAVVAYVREHDEGAPSLDDIALAVSEAVSNAVVHAFVGRDPGAIHVRIDEEHGTLRIVVRDDGRGMQPRTDSPGLGLGMPLIATLSRRFETHAKPGVGTKLCMWFDEHPPVGAPAIG